MTLIGAAQAQVTGPLPLVPSPWQVLFGDPTFLVLNALTFGIVIAVLLTVRRRYARFYRIQREALDHRKTADAQSLARGQSTEELIARQYGVINAHNAQIAARAEEALRISSETLAQINTMNQSLARIASRLDSMSSPPA
jgi:type IV secretory pathway component VirB8